MSAESQTILQREPAAAWGADVNERGELLPAEFSFRAGLLLGAVLFFQESMSFPWSRNLFGVAGMLVAALIVMTMSFGWRVLGDWRRRTQQALYVIFAFALSLPVAAVLSPSLGMSALPDMLEGPIVELLAFLRSVPGLSLIVGFITGFLSFLVLAITLIVLLIGSTGDRRGGLTFIAIMMTGICLLLYPSIETAAGFLFLYGFVYTQWEVPVLVPDRLRAHLRATQAQFLRELVREGTLSTGETRLLLENDPANFAELVDYGLVEYDSIARGVFPGERLLRDPSAQAVETIFLSCRRVALASIGIIYFILPDLIPGKIDDMIILFLCLAGGFNLKTLLAGRALRRGGRLRG